MPAYNVKFSYRVYSRIHEREQLGKIRYQIESVYPKAIFGEELHRYWPVAPEQIDSLRQRGILITEKGDDLCMIIQEIPIRIKVESYSQGEQLIKELNLHFPNTFATMSVCAEWLTEIVAV